MQTLHPVLKRGMMIWDRAGLPPAVFQDRLRHVQAAIAAADHDAWLVYGDAQQYGNIAYLTHYLPRVRGALTLVPRAGDPILLVAFSSRDVPEAKELTWVDDVRPFTRLPPEVVRLVRDEGLERGRVGLVGVEELLSVGEWDAIRRELPDVSWQPTGDALADLRAAKAAPEAAMLRQAAANVGAALDVAAEALRPGVAERVALAQVDRALRYGGAEDTRLLIASGPRAGSGLRPADDRVLAAGDGVLLHAAASHQRYWAEGSRTFVLGAPDGETRALLETAQAAVAAMVAAARLGAGGAAVAAAALAHLRDRGQTARALEYGLGHGIGLDLEEPPFVRPDDATPLPAGAALALHIVLHGPAGRGALASQMILVSAAGTETLG
jgi:Xaa-Pro aminopeptidase